MYVYSKFGYSLPHSAPASGRAVWAPACTPSPSCSPATWCSSTTPARNAGKACSHAGIYIGNGQHIHASSSRSGGVIISDLTTGYYNDYFVGGIHV